MQFIILLFVSRVCLTTMMRITMGSGNLKPKKISKQEAKEAERLRLERSRFKSVELEKDTQFVHCAAHGEGTWKLEPKPWKPANKKNPGKRKPKHHVLASPFESDVKIDRSTVLIFFPKLDAKDKTPICYVFTLPEDTKVYCLNYDITKCTKKGSEVRIPGPVVWKQVMDKKMKKASSDLKNKKTPSAKKKRNTKRKKKME
jgi:hypothetical protein